MCLADRAAQLILVQQVREIHPGRSAEAVVAPGSRVDVEKLVGAVAGVVFELQLNQPVVVDVLQELARPARPDQAG